MHRIKSFCHRQVNHIKKGLNPSSASKIYFSGPHVKHGLRIGAIAGMVALTVYYIFLHLRN